MPFAIERHQAVTSTMDVARTRAHAGAPDGTVVIAESMTGGRGTHGRTWHAPPGGLYLSLIIRDLQDPHLLTLALGNAVADVLEVAGAQPRLKWVNDVWLEGRKVAGILVEGEATGAKFDFLVAGIGINVNGHAAQYPADLQATATTLEDLLGCDSCIPDIETYLLSHIEFWLQRVREGRDGDIIARWRDRDALIGRRVTLEDGTVRVTGTAKGIDGQGRFLIQPHGQAVQAFANGRIVDVA